MTSHSTRIINSLAFVCALATAAPAYAHHEAIFGPQSSAALTWPDFLSVQVFDVQRGKGDEKTHTTTTVFSGGVTPFRAPVSLAFVVPLSIETEPGGASKRGVEDALLAGRYQRDTNRLSEALHLESSFVMAVAGLELPTGNMDHPFGHGRPGSIAAGLISLERRPIAMIAYTYLHKSGEYQGNRASGNVFAGGGVAWTPIDNEAEGKLFSLQLGGSYERTTREHEAGEPIELSGGRGTFLHPTVVFDIGTHVQMFTIFSLPVAQSWRDPNDRQRFRFGSGAIFKL
ncbi:MAG: hypothetical protein DMF87_21540 [Acidobacteria bacterium]|nr:MAG: hypothetical protein DMF87_21540 [Acidobacteriota bacterium]